jgi:uncharacterized protein involved in type VI secretion and phage assembly
MDRHPGKHGGLVTDNDDPKGLGRIRALVPEVLLQETTGWALPSAPFAGPGAGFHAVPPVGAAVWIEWPNGDPMQPPIWSSYWTDGDGVAGAGPSQVVVVTPAGHRLLFDDDVSEVTVEVSGGAQIVLGQNQATVEVAGQRIELSPSGVSINSGALEVQ